MKRPEEIQNEIEKYGWTYVEGYDTLDTVAHFTCPQGHKVDISLKELRKSYACPICAQQIFKKIEAAPVLPKSKGDRILAVDQATITSGYSVFDNKSLTHYGLFPVRDDLPKVQRISLTKNWLINTIHNIKPNYIFFEDIQLQNFSGNKGAYLKGSSNSVGITTFKTLAELLGTLEVVAYEAGVDFEVVPSGVWRAKTGVTGRARADRKKSAQLLVKKWYDINVTQDEADAICLGKYGSSIYRPKVEMFKWE